MRSKKALKTEVFIGIFSVVLAVAYFILTFTIKEKGSLKGVSYNSISPNFLPSIIGILGIVVAFSILIPAVINYVKAPKGLPEYAEESKAMFLTKDRIIIIISMVVYLCVIKYIGYIISTFALSFGLLTYLERTKKKRNLIFSVLFVIVCFCVFNYALQIWLPIGTIFGQN